MLVKKLELKNFRNYDNLAISFTDGLNVISGLNASGKTNLVESIYYSGLGKSPRTSKDKDLIKWDNEKFFIKIFIQKKYRDHIVEIIVDKDGKKIINIDKIPIRKISELIGLLNIVYFSPDELDIVKEGPSERRRFIDISISQQKTLYFNALVKYNKILNQRNKLLKTYQDEKIIRENIVIWDMQLAKVGAYIIKNRYEFIENFKKIAYIQHKNLSNDKEELDVEYETKITNDSVENIEKQYLSLLENSLDKDISLKYTTIGIHRDDLSLTVNGIDVRNFGSQGQKRSVALSLKLAEVALFEEKIGEKPILILDDVLSELDKVRQNKLLEVIENTQTFITCTDYNEKCNKKITISNGKVIEEK